MTEELETDINFHPNDIFFPVRDNPKIKKIGSHTIITPERGAEILRCMEDPIYFCENYLKLITLDHGLQPFKPRPYQVKTINTIIQNRFVIAKWGRQPLCINTLVKTPDGYSTLRDIKAGDVVIGSNNKHTKVLSTTVEYTDNISIFEIQIGNSLIKADSDHIWQVEIDGSTEELSTLMIKKAIETYEVFVPTLNGSQKVKYVTAAEVTPVKCIEIDAPDSLFCITEQDILTHNSGKTTTIAATLVWLVLFGGQKKEYEAAVLAHKQDQAIEILDRVKLYYENIPLWMQKSVKTWNKKTVELEGNIKFFAAATGSGAVRGRTLDFVFADEFGLVRDAEEFYTGTFPTISTGTDSKFIIASTPKGFNYYYKLWKDAEDKKSDFIPLSINWWDVPGRDEAWKKGEIARTSPALFSQEYEATFLGSSNTLIAGLKLGAIPTIDPVMMDESKDILHIFTLPIKEHKYLICADVSEGVGGDSSSFIVVDVTLMPYTIVATYDNDMLDPLMYPNVLFDLGTYYNTAYIAIESNTIGHGVVNTLYMDLEYENIISTNTKNKVTDDIMEGGRQILGIRQTKKTKHKGNSTLKTLVENDQLIINDFRVFYQLSRFIRKGSSFAAEPGEHDDLVMCLVLFAYITTLPTFKEITGTDLALTMNQRTLFEQQHLPFGVIVDSGIMNQDITDFNSLGEFDQWMIS